MLAITAEESIERNQVIQIPDVPAETKRVQAGQAAR